MTRILDATVVIPTVGRVLLLRGCLESLVACDPRPSEVLVIDQSGDNRVASLIDELDLPGLLRVGSTELGIARALNMGLALSTHDRVLVTHDDCVVAADWVGIGVGLLERDRTRVYTGRVLPTAGDGHVPSTHELGEGVTWVDKIQCGMLFPSNMALPRAEVLSLGAFDERFTSAAEDNDFAYRWLRSGRCIEHDPDLVVWHADWRSVADLRKLYDRYWRAQGEFYGKHLRAGERAILRLIARDLRNGAAALRECISVRGPQRADARRGVFAHLPAGIASGLLRLGSRPPESSPRAVTARAASRPSRR